MDIPLFMADAESTVLTSADMTPLSGCLESPAVARVFATVRDLNDTDLAFQLQVMRGLFQTCRSAAHDASVRAPTACALEPSAPVRGDTAWREATAIADSLLASMITTPRNGAVCWLGLQTDRRGERRFRPVGEALFDGRLGIALFLAAMASAGGDARYREAALHASEPIIALARARNGRGREQHLRSAGIGGLTGVGSTLYGLVRIGEFLVEPGFMTYATWYAEALTPASIASDDKLDVVNGTAGALLALIRLFEITRAPELLSRAVLCGEHLLGSRVPTPHGHRAWPSSAGATPMAGFSHGASGIAHALLALFARTRRPEFRDAALEGFAYERALFDPAARNWQDLRGGSAPYMASWCHGAPGIGMARVAALEVCALELLADDLAKAVDGTLHLARAPVDHYCCGEFGRITFLGEALEETAARSRAGRVLADREESGAFRLFGDLPEAENPGFFQGLAGIGYGWLRLAGKAAFPNVLMLA
jgi:type 2 lantibiotic biosynthesis protein LanM